MIEIISGTNRPGCSTLKVAKVILGLYQSAGVEAQILNLQDLPPELFLPDAYANKPATFLPYQERVLQSEGLHVVIPEYNGSFPGVMKYFVDMLKFPESFEHRPVTYTGLGAGLWGNIRGVEQMQLVFNYRNAYNLPERTWLAGSGKKIKEDGSIDDPFFMELLKGQVKQFASFVERNKGTAPHAIAK